MAVVDEIVPNSKLETAVAERAKEFAAVSKRNGSGKGIALTPLKRIIDATSIRYGFVSVDIDRAQRHRHHLDQGARNRAAIRYRRVDRAGRGVWPLQVARELDDAILSSAPSTNSKTAMLLFKSHGDRANVLAADAFLEANKAHWLVNEIRQYWKRVLKRIDVTRARWWRWSSRAPASPARSPNSCSPPTAPTC